MYNVPQPYQSTKIISRITYTMINYKVRLFELHYIVTCASTIDNIITKVSFVKNTINFLVSPAFLALVEGLRILLLEDADVGRGFNTGI